MGTKRRPDRPRTHRGAYLRGNAHHARRPRGLDWCVLPGEVVTPQTVGTLRQRPELAAQVPRLHRDGWPVFLRQDPVADRYWDALFTTFADFQLVVSEI